MHTFLWPEIAEHNCQPSENTWLGSEDAYASAQWTPPPDQFSCWIKPFLEEHNFLAIVCSQFFWPWVPLELSWRRALQDSWSPGIGVFYNFSEIQLLDFPSLYRMLHCKIGCMLTYHVILENDPCPRNLFKHPEMCTSHHFINISWLLKTDICSTCDTWCNPQYHCQLLSAYQLLLLE